MFKAPLSFSGRITRTEYFLSGLLFILAIATVIGLRDSGPFLSLIMLPGLWFVAAQGWKRSQDAGWHGIVGLIPYVNFLLLFPAGDAGSNAHGPNPRLRAEGATGPSAEDPDSYTPPALPDAWERARGETAPVIHISSFKCKSCGAQNTNVEHTGSACCQFCGAPKG